MIPRHIYYCWFGSAALPNNYQHYLRTWQEHNPGFEVTRIDENNFDVNFCPFTNAAYQAGKMAFVSDAARIWVVYHYGGIYFDIDVEELKPLEPLLVYRHFWAKEDAGLVASGLGFGAEAHNNMLGKILQTYEQLDFDVNNLSSINTVHVVSSVLKTVGLQNNLRNNELQQDGIALAPKYFAPFHYWGGGRIHSETIAVHHYAEQPSWTKVPRSFPYYLIHQMMFYCPHLGSALRWLKKKAH